MRRQKRILTDFPHTSAKSYAKSFYGVYKHSSTHIIISNIHAPNLVQEGILILMFVQILDICLGGVCVVLASRGCCPTAMHGGVHHSRSSVFNSSIAFAIQPVNGLPAALSMRLYSRWCRAMKSIVTEKLWLRVLLEEKPVGKQYCEDRARNG